MTEVEGRLDCLEGAGPVGLRLGKIVSRGKSSLSDPNSRLGST